MKAPTHKQSLALVEAARLLDQLALWIDDAELVLPPLEPDRLEPLRSPENLTTEQAAMLASAEEEYRNRRGRDKILSKEFTGEPAWDMLLQLFIKRLRGDKSSVTNISMASQSALSTALRYVRGLEEAGFVERSQSRSDNRVVNLELSNSGLAVMQKIMRARLPAPKPKPTSSDYVLWSKD